MPEMESDRRAVSLGLPVQLFLVQVIGKVENNLVDLFVTMEHIVESVDCHTGSVKKMIYGTAIQRRKEGGSLQTREPSGTTCRDRNRLPIPRKQNQRRARM